MICILNIKISVLGSVINHILFVIFVVDGNLGKGVWHEWNLPSQGKIQVELTNRGNLIQIGTVVTGKLVTAVSVFFAAIL